MNKKSTLIAAALMAVSSFTVSAAPGDEVNSKEWTAGNYYYLKSDNNYLSLCGTKADSVVFKVFGNEPSKAARDSALWEITKVRTETGGNTIYQFKNKKTKALLSFSPVDYKPVLAEGVSEWSISSDGKIVSYLAEDKLMAFALVNGTDGKKDFVLKKKVTDASAFTVNYPESAVSLEANELGDNFSVFRLSFGDKFDGDIFSGQDIVASKSDKNWVRLQVKDDMTFDDGKTAKYFGLDTTKVEITGATDVFGAKFVLDSTYTDDVKGGIKYHTVGNGDFQQFQFKVDLKNDSLVMLVKNAPIVNGDLELCAENVQVVFTKVGTTQLLTVSKINEAGKPINGAAPFITVEKGTPAKIEGGTGVYFLKSASKGENGGKYISSFNEKDHKIVPMTTGKPSVNQLEGQWYIKEDNGMYSIVDRKSNTSMLLKGEVFAVQGMANTFTFGGNADSITVEPQKVNLDDKFLGSANFTTAEMANNGYALNLIPAGAETSSSYTVTADSILQVKSVDGKDAVIFKIVAVDTLEIGGAQALKDTVSIVKYQLKSQFSDKYVAYDTEKKSLKVSSSADALDFFFNINVDGGKYSMKIATDNNDGKFITADLASSNMVLSETPAYFNFVEMEAPEYGAFESGNKRFTSDLKSLTMNPLNFFAEAKQEGQDILKSTYEKDNFSLWLSKSKASTAEKPLYFIMTSLAVDGVPGVDRDYFYMVSGRDSSLLSGSAARVNFIKNDTIETMKDSSKNPALFALKVTESGNYLLENQKEVTVATGTPYVGIINNVVVMTKDGVEFSVEAAPAPVANEEIEAPNTIKVIGGVGEFSIRNAHGKKITVSNILGQTIATRVVSSDYATVPTTRGVVIVSVDGDQAYKVIVK
ncbi:DUF6383 domain-containing protein [Parabacteroides timonensis]|uniref:DUF6383 domain-containing protein n=1 Tax=Parabacteroides timonensis TaxID=1871013 RepID=UPI00094E5D9D|nr:DUF6383 domain-containing protein [Parabacteroides timonensis]